MFQLALIQMEVLGGEKARNLRRAEMLISEAASAGARLLLLPEALDLGWTHPSALEQAEPIPSGEPCQRLAEAAQRHQVYICAGLTEQARGAVYNAAVLISPQGQVILTHRKLNELEIGHPYYAQGNRLSVCTTAFGAIGLMICADAFARDQVISRSLGYMGADLILSPCAWAVEAGHDNERQPYGDLWRSVYRPVARDFSLWIAGASNVGRITGGPWEGRKCIGCSLVVGPQGQVALQGPYGVTAETILYVDVEPMERPARGDSWAGQWDAQS